MSMQILALIVMVISFTLLFVWVYLPGNRSRFEDQAKLILEPDDIDDTKNKTSDTNRARGGQS